MKKQNIILFCVVTLVVIAAMTLIFMIYRGKVKADETSKTNTLEKSLEVRTFDDLYHYLSSIDETSTGEAAGKIVGSVVVPYLNTLGLEVGDEETERITKEVYSLLDSMIAAGLITYDDDGELTLLSRAYIADAVTYAVTSVIGNPVIGEDFEANNEAMPNTQSEQNELINALSNLEELKSVVNAVIEEREKQSVLTNSEPSDTSPVDTFTDDLSTYDKLITAATKDRISELYLKLEALEIIVNSLKNESGNVDNQDVNSDTKKFQKLEAEITKLDDEITKNKNKLSLVKENLKADTASNSDAVLELTNEITKLSKELETVSLSASKEMKKISDEIDKNNNELCKKEEAFNNLYTDVISTLEELSDELKLSDKELSDKLIAFDIDSNALRKEMLNTTSANSIDIAYVNSKFENKLKDLNENLTEYISDVKANILNNIGKNQADIEKNVLETEKNLSLISENTAEISKHTAAIENINKTVSDNINSINAAQKELISQAGQINSNEYEINVNKSDILKQGEIIDLQSTKLTNHEESLNLHKDLLNEHNEQLGNNSKEIASNKSLIEENSSAIADSFVAINDNLNSIKENKELLENNSKAISENKDKIEANQKNIEDNTLGIVFNSNLIDANTKEIASLETNLKKSSVWIKDITITKAEWTSVQREGSTWYVYAINCSSYTDLLDDYSDITISYKDNTKLACEYAIKDLNIMIYVKNIPNNDIVINSIHIENEITE